MQFDRRAFLATLGTAAAINAMPSEALADALEHHMMENLDTETTTRAEGSPRHGATIWRAWAQRQSPGGTGNSRHITLISRVTKPAL